MDGDSTHGLRLDQLAELFAVGSDDPDTMREDDLRERLHYQLTCALPRGSLLFDALVMMMGRLGCDVRSLAGRSLLDVLLNPGSDIGLLQAIKDCSKKLSFTLESKAEAALATTIYYAVLASALVHHDRKITQYSFAALAQSFAAFAAKKWIPPELTELFLRACRICQDRQETDEKRSHRTSD